MSVTISIAISALYFAVLATLLNAQPLWLDEILQLLGTRGRSLAELLDWVAINPGAAPLGYLTQWGALQIFGFTTFSARLSSALFSALSGLTLVALSRRLGLRTPAAAFLLFALMPLQFRYALEARPYSQGLFFALWCTLEAVNLRDRPGIASRTRYTLAVACGLYTQPYTAFAALAHALWMPRLSAPLAAAGALFLPWFLHARGQWREHLDASGHHFAFSLKTLAMLFRESCGGGYLLAVAIAALAVAGLCSPHMLPPVKRLLALSVAVPVAAALAADAVFGYFFAIRQVLAILPPLCLLAAEGLRAIPSRLALPIVALAAVLSLFHIGRSLSPHRRAEDWELAARVIRSSVSPGDCLAVPADGQLSIYSFFEPDLPLHACGEGRPNSARVVAALSSYTSPGQRRRLIGRLGALGFSQAAARTVGGTEIALFRNCSPHENPEPCPIRWPRRRDPDLLLHRPGSCAISPCSAASLTPSVLSAVCSLAFYSASSASTRCLSASPATPFF